jgi:hypothetical protein
MAGKSTATVTGVPVLFLDMPRPPGDDSSALWQILGQMTVVLTEMSVPQPLPSALA